MAQVVAAGEAPATEVAPGATEEEATAAQIAAAQAAGATAAMEAAAVSAVARSNEAWGSSSERVRARVVYVLAILLTYGFAALVWVVLHYSEDLELTFRGKVITAAAFVLGGFVVAAGGAMYMTSARGRFEQRLASARAEQALEQLTSAMELKDLLQINRKQMQAYDALARGQAASSYRVAQIAITVGLLVLVGGSIVAIAAQDETTKITTAALTASGGAIAGYIGRTFLRTYERALEQLNFYFEQPLVTSYILTAERVSETMSAARRDDIREKIVERIMDGLIRPYETITK
jgi:hypothetical protein